MMELVRKYLISEGYNNISTNVTVTGKSGVQHCFDILATKSYNQKDSIAVDIIRGEKEVDLTEMLKIFAKLHDVMPQSYVLVTPSDLTNEAKRFADYYHINVVKREEIEKEVIREQFVPTGVPGLDKILGGFLKGRVYLLVGPAGTGKTTIGLEFLLQACKNGGRGILITTDQKPDKLIFDFELSGIYLKDFIDKGLLHILDLTRQIEELKMKVNRGDISPIDYSSRIINDLCRHASTIKPERITIDSFTSLTLRDHPWNRDIVRRLILSIEDIGATTLLVKAAPPSERELEENFVQGVLVLSYDGTDRYIQVTKARGATFDGRKHRIGFKRRIGVYVEE